MARVAIFCTVDDEVLASDDVGGVGGLEDSLRARLGEVFDDNGNPIDTFRMVGIDVDDD